MRKLLLGLAFLLPATAVAQDRMALQAITAHPAVRARMDEVKARLVWMDWQGPPGLTCFALKEDQPTHVVQVDTFCLDRARGRVLRYDVVEDRYVPLP